MKRTILSLLVSAFLQISFSQTVTLDPTFGTNGIVSTPLGLATSVINGMAIQNDGKIVAAGTSCDGNITEFAIARYNSDGSLDTAFGQEGKVITFFGSAAAAQAVAIQNDGKIVAGGYRFTDSTWEFATARYKTNGDLDTTFGMNGMVSTAVGNIEDIINAICIQKDGKIIATGYSYVFDINTTSLHVSVVRYNTDGSLDNTFNDDGKIITTIGIADYANAVAVQPDGKIVVGGTYYDGSTYGFLLIRYQQNGSRDSSFNGDGVVTNTINNINDVIHSILIQEDGKLIVAGSSAATSNFDSYNFAIAKYNIDGTPDNSFNGNGKVVSTVNSYYDISPRLALGDNGKLVVGATTSNGSTRYMALTRYNANGIPDSSFDQDGKIVTTISGNAIIYAMKVFGSRIYVAGSTDQFLIAAYQQLSTLPVNLLSFNGIPKTNSTLLHWQTTGQDNVLYEVERSNDGRTFSKIGEVNSLLNTSAQKNYSFIDNFPLKAKSFYRLKMVNTASITYSKIVTINRNETNLVIKVYPNPVSELLYLQIPSTQKENISIQITDASGKVLKREAFISEGTTISKSIKVNHLPENNYFLTVQKLTGNQTIKFIKK